MGKIEASRHIVREIFEKLPRQSTGVDEAKGGATAVTRLTGAIARAILVMVLIITPSVLLSEVHTDARQMAALVALFGGVLTFVEYNAVYPGLIEFRDAPPFNRLRYLMLFFTVLCLTVIEAGRVTPTTASELVSSIGMLIGVSMDFPYSPVRLATLMMSDAATPGQVTAVRTAAGMAYLISLVSLSVFVVMLKLGNWPRRDIAFNVWVNLPTFDPTAGGDVVARLTRDARVNIALGFLLPFLTPAVISVASTGFEPLTLTSPQTLIWTLTAWSFLPASLFMRGIAMGRVAEMISEKRKAGGSPGGAASFATA